MNFHDGSHLSSTLHCTYLPIFGFYEGGCNGDFNKQGHVSAASVAAAVISHLGWSDAPGGPVDLRWVQGRGLAAASAVCVHSRVCLFQILVETRKTKKTSSLQRRMFVSEQQIHIYHYAKPSLNKIYLFLRSLAAGEQQRRKADIYMQISKKK